MITTSTAREAFDAAIARATTPDAMARLELAREFFTNPEFRQRLQDFAWATRTQ